MRKLLIEHFVLGYFFRIFGKLYNAPRASRVIFPLMVLTGYLNIEPSPLSWVVGGITCIALYLGFIHFSFFPVKWEELDVLQKLQYGLVKPLSDTQRDEWLAIYKEKNDEEFFN